MDQDVLRWLEKLESLIDRRFDKVEETQADVQRRVGNLEVIAAEQKEQIKYHIKRTDLSEQRAEDYRKESQQGDALIYAKIDAQRKEMSDQIEPLKTQHAAAKMSGRWLIGGVTFILTIAGTVAAWLALK